MVQINSIDISPPLINSSCAWAGDFNQLEALFNSPYTGAVTTRSSTLNGYKETEANAVGTSVAAGRMSLLLPGL